MNFTFSQLNLDCFAINLGDCTVATVTPHGRIDWRLKSPQDSGSLITSIDHETHLAHVLGLKMNLNLPDLCEEMVSITPNLIHDGQGVRLSARSRSVDGSWEGRHLADMTVNPDTGRFEWAFETTLTCLSETPVVRDWIEYNNILSAETGRGMLFASRKQYDCTLLTAYDGTVWKFPHQHTLHYAEKIRKLRFSPGTMAGFFGEALNPVVVLHSSTLEPDWAICDMFYDLHCGSRVTTPIQPGATHRWTYTVRYLDARESAPYLEQAKPIVLDPEDYSKCDFPRLDLGRNRFDRAVMIDGLDDADCFRTNPPVKVWDRHAGPHADGALRITSSSNEETVWSAEPPNQIPASASLQLRGLMKTEDVVGKGLFLRLRYHCFQWRPQRHFEWIEVIESVPVAGTTDWTRIETPVLAIPAEFPDRFVWIDVVLDGQGVGWLADLEVDLRKD
jgi:hypothetical protein